MSDQRDYSTVVEAATYDETGRITGVVKQGIGFTEDALARGERLLLGDAGWDPVGFKTTRYVDLSSGDPMIQDRPVLAQTFDRPTLPVRQEATLENVPACRVTFVGPVSGTHDHPGGDLEVGFTVSGDYLISFEAFPNLPCTHQLTVTP
ncbi:MULTISPECIES: hypothetical protein [unclassified Methylobacterium]|uniref:hypothetical protein n=1 Tax=unclassified Methylobacterium TaxID=2615210 RepID=UPI0011C1E2F4|nr:MULTISPECIES: hypothetical protein [unclassified Methylobacterium]QEE37938.1 hypothetical protein FVA80_02135 [Methylobacterium sp. WL1]TXN59357.1 hypothetical protein FV241_02280 [Methylobacterium sp. WL2]